MFTGIIETIGIVQAIKKEQSNLHFTISSSISQELKIDQSLAHNGVCLTIISLNGNTHTVTAIEETLKKTTLGTLKIGDAINLERCMPANGRFDGHIVQGHVDQTAICTHIENQHGSILFHFEYNAQTGNITVEKGSICINGISLTVVNSSVNSFSVCIIPYTLENTNMKHIKVGSLVNLEFDILGKYIAKIFQK